MDESSRQHAPPVAWLAARLKMADADLRRLARDLVQRVRSSP